ncbi:MAG: glycosyltransferase [Desulfurococcaceae archaeon]
MLNTLEILGLTLALAHFTVPLAYYAYAKLKWLKKPWNLGVDENYKPKVTVIIPTYNEAKFIEKKLDNVYEQDYPKELVEILVVDSASTDGTPRLVEEWSRRHNDVMLRQGIAVEFDEKIGRSVRIKSKLKFTRNKPQAKQLRNKRKPRSSH